MSDIPVGSPPAPPGRHAAPGGWYPDPLDRARERYWDGWQWSRNTREAELAPAHPAARPAGAAPGPYGVPPAALHGVRGTGISRQAATTADGVPLAGWWWRALAGLMDAALVGTLTALLTLPFYSEAISAFSAFYSQVLAAAQSGGTPPPTPDLAAAVSGSDRLLIMLITFVVGMVYQVLLLRFRGATLGLLACGMRVVPVDEGRSPTRLEWPRVMARSLIWVAPWALNLGILSIADVLLPLWHPRRQTLHDLAARTQVVRGR